MRDDIIDIKWEKEADLCREFAAVIARDEPDWTVYPETGGYDMVLAHKDGPQIAVEAKLVLNAKVLCQVMPRWSDIARGPDFRAVLVGRAQGDMIPLADHLHITTLMLDVRWQAPRRFDQQGPSRHRFTLRTKLPEVKPAAYGKARFDWFDREGWYDLAPSERIKLPEYVPQVEAGHPAPMVLSDWKIKAMKVCQWVIREQTITRAHFKALKIDPSRWMNGYWLEKAEGRGHWRAARQFPGDAYRNQHPEVWAQIEADYANWSKPLTDVGVQEALI